MLEYTPEGLVLRNSIAQVRLAFTEDRVGFCLQLVISPAGEGSLSAEVRTTPFKLSQFGVGFAFLPGPQWKGRATEAEQRNPEGHRDYVLSEALRQSRINMSCSVETVDGSEFLFFRARLGLDGSVAVEGKTPFPMVARFIERATELAAAK